MNVCAIIAEYNPLHAGHLYQLAQTRARLGADTRLVAVMSGHAVQRGDVPILSKYARTELALRAGFDLVFELPLPFALARADRFARGGVAVAEDLGFVTHLSFGAESDDLSALQAVAALRPERFAPDESQARFWPAHYPEHAALFTPNNILALEYLRALAAEGSDIQPLLIPRCGSAHDDDIASASAYRQRLSQTDSEPAAASALPFGDIWRREREAGRAPLQLSRLEGALLSALRRMSREDFLRLPDVSGGLAERLWSAAQAAGRWDELLSTAKTKRYPLARIRRALLCAFFGITEADAQQRPHLRLLGLGAEGAGLLSRAKNPILSRPAAQREALRLEADATAQLGLCAPQPWSAGEEWLRGVVKLKRP